MTEEEIAAQIMGARPRRDAMPPLTRAAAAARLGFQVGIAKRIGVPADAVRAWRPCERQLLLALPYSH